MPHRPDALKHLPLNCFAIVMTLAGLSLAWARATPLLGELAGAGALVLGAAAALAFVALALLSWLRWQHWPQALAADMRHPVRHAFVAMVPVSLLLLATAGVSLLGTHALLAALWWAGSLLQLAATLWVLGRWLAADKASAPGWAAITPVLFVPVVGNVLAPLAGPALGAPGWSAAQFGLGLLLWPVLLALVLARVPAQGPWPDRLLPTVFITVAPPAVIGTATLQLGGPLVLGWMCWGVALLFLLWGAQASRRLLAQPFGLALWSLGFPLAAFAALTLRLAAQHPGAATLAMMALALATLVAAVLGIATFKSWREGSLLVPEPVAIVASPGSGAPPGPL
ncbi:MAG: C4-dicarboxylate ABC transporter [Pseudomonadota bacterium]|nr:C4-dicarboxylate ABC transporter [Pseudomonadota bacterium]